MVPLLRTLLVAFKQEHPAAFQDISIKKSVLECLLVGVEQGVPMMYPVSFKANPKSDGTVEIVSTVTPISPNETTMTALGHSELIVDAVRKDPACFDRSLTPAQVINELLMSECNAHPAEVRPPISLLELCPYDCFWLQGPYEKE